MRSALLQSEFVRLYAIDELRVMRSEMLLYARMYPPGPQRNQRRQAAHSAMSVVGGRADIILERQNVCFGPRPCGNVFHTPITAGNRA